MKIIAIGIITLLFQVTNLSAQEELDHSDILVTPENWGKELFEFPIRFAKEIPFSGMEEARFPKGWGNSESPEFWTYAFAWKIETTEELTDVDFEVNLQYYFDGLLGLTFDRKEKVQLTNANFLLNGASENIKQYKGKLKTFDTRFLNKPMTLYVKAISHFCKKEKQSIILFKFSPQQFDQIVWDKLDRIMIKEGFCNH